VRRYAAGTQDTSEPASKWDEIVGIAVAMITVSSVETTMHSARPKKQATTFLKGRRLVWSVSSMGRRELGLAFSERGEASEAWGCMLSAVLLDVCVQSGFSTTVTEFILKSEYTGEGKVVYKNAALAHDFVERRNFGDRKAAS
jgi:hypothetical protein